MQEKYNILHITPHLGGGVGKVLVNYLTKVKISNLYHNSLLSLDFINDKAKSILQEENIEFYDSIYTNTQLILEHIKKADIVVIHWWNHPLLFDFLVRNKLPDCRVAIWSHISGNDAPYVFSHKLFDYSDVFVFTTPISLLTQEVQNYHNTNKLYNIWSTGGLEEVKNITKKEHKGFNIGFIGVLDFAKLHPNFANICAHIDIPDVKFIICGDGCDKDILIQQIKNLGIEDKFEFTGYVNDIVPYLEIFDLFGYPLNKTHYGTCDQVLAEAMGCGTIPIVFDNNMEKYMVHDTYSGLVVSTEQEYIDAIKTIYKDKKLRNLLQDNAKKEANHRFGIDATVVQWDSVFNQLLSIEKTKKHWLGKYSGESVSTFEIFMESIGNYADIFETNDIIAIQKLFDSSLSWKSKTKGTPNHYLSFFNDEKLAQIEQLNIKEYKNGLK